jgi:hypothetical protein
VAFQLTARTLDSGMQKYMAKIEVSIEAVSGGNEI